MKLQTTNNGYIHINLQKKGKHIQYPVHRLVAESFIENKPDNYKNLVVNHLDGVKTNNHVDNLEYVTQSENLLHSCREIHKTGKPVQIINFKTGEIVKTLPSGVQAAEYLEVTVTSVYNVCRGINKTCKDFILKYVEEESKGEDLEEESKDSEEEKSKEEHASDSPTL